MRSRVSLFLPATYRLDPAPHPRLFKQEGVTGNRAYAARIDRWQSTVNNLAAAVPDIPAADQVYAEARDMCPSWG